MVVALILYYLLWSLAPASAVESWADGVDQVYRRAHRAPPVRDARLDEAALAAANAEPGTDLRMLCRYSGVYEGLVLPVVVVGPDDPVVQASWATYVKQQVVPRDVTHYGLAREGDRVAAVFTRRTAVLEPTPATPRPGDTPRLSGELPNDFTRVRVLVGKPDEQVVQLPVNRFGRHVWTDLSFDAGSGVYQVEVLADGRRGTEVVALLPIPVGVPTPDAPTLGRAGFPPGAAEDGLAAEERLLHLVNEERRRLGLRPLRADGALEGTATSHAGRMAQVGLAAHVLPGGRGPAARLRDAGVSADRFYENVAMARTVQQAHDELWASPSHRMALADPEMRRIGIGIAAARSDTGSVLFVAQHLAP